MENMLFHYAFVCVIVYFSRSRSESKALFQCKTKEKKITKAERIELEFKFEADATTHTDYSIATCIQSWFTWIDVLLHSSQNVLGINSYSWTKKNAHNSVSIIDIFAFFSHTLWSVDNCLDRFSNFYLIYVSRRWSSIMYFKPIRSVRALWTSSKYVT